MCKQIFTTSDRATLADGKALPVLGTNVAPTAHTVAALRKPYMGLWLCSGDQDEVTLPRPTAQQLQAQRFRTMTATDADTSSIYTTLIKEDVSDPSTGWQVLCDVVDPEDGAVICRLHKRQWLGLGDMLRLECTYRGCTVEGIAEALQDMLVNGAPELAEMSTATVSKHTLSEAAGLLPAGATEWTVYQKATAPMPLMSDRDHVLRFSFGFIEPLANSSQADQGSKVLFDTQTTCQSADYPVERGVVRMNNAKTTTYEQRGEDVYSIEFMYTDIAAGFRSG